VRAVLQRCMARLPRSKGRCKVCPAVTALNAYVPARAAQF
jgi:hypothetical protein